MNRAEHRRRERAQAKAAKTRRGPVVELPPLPPMEPAPRPPLWPLLLIIVAGVAVYANSFQGVFVLDDMHSIVQNQQIRSFDRIWSQRPLVTLTLALNYHFGQLNPWGYHLVNVTIHVLAALTLFGVVRRALLMPSFRSRFEKHAHVVALAIALIWAVHPLQTQSVTYIIQRGESLMGLFYLLTIYTLLRGVASETPRRWYVLTVIACALGMVSKAVMVTAPAVVLLLDVCLVTRSLGKTLRARRGLYLSLAAMWLILATTGVIKVIFAAGPGQQFSAGFSYQGHDAIEYLQTQPGVILHYLRLSVWPHPLCLDYMWPIARTPAAIVLPGLAVFALLVATIWALRWRPWLGALGATFFIILSPTSSFIPIKDVAFEHRMYLPVIVPITLLVLGAHYLMRRLAQRPETSPALVKWMGVSVLVLAAAACGYATIDRNRDYHSESTMWLNVIAQRPNNARAHSDLGRLLRRQGHHEEALVYLRRSIELDPTLRAGHNNIGNALVREGKIDEGIKHLKEAVRLWPDEAQYHNNLGVAYLKKGDQAKATELFAKAVELDPNYPEGHSNLGNSLATQGKYEEAIAEYRESIRLKPHLADAHNNLGAAFLNLGRIDEAISCFEEALRLRPDWTDAINNMKIARSRADQ